MANTVARNADTTTRADDTAGALLRERAAVGTEAVGLHLRVDRRPADPEPAGGQRGVAIAAQRRRQRRALDRADRAIGQILEPVAVAQAIELDRRQLDALVGGL